MEISCTTTLNMCIEHSYFASDINLHDVKYINMEESYIVGVVVAITVTDKDNLGILHNYFDVHYYTQSRIETR